MQLAASALIGERVSGPFRFTGQLNASATRFATAGSHALALASTRIEYATAGIGLFLRGSAGASGVSGNGGPLVRVSGGARAGGGRSLVELTVSTTNYVSPHVRIDGTGDPSVDTTFANRHRRNQPRAQYTQAELLLAWRGRGWSAGIEVGGRTRNDAGGYESWANVRGEKRVLPGLAVIGAAGWSPSAPELGLARRPVASFAFRITAPPSWHTTPIDVEQPPPARSVTQVIDLGGERRILRIPAAGASSVEIMADFTDWGAVALKPDADGYWAISLQLPAGHYRINVRFDGGPWTVPPGLVPIHDEFGGMAGTLLID